MDRGCHLLCVQQLTLDHSEGKHLLLCDALVGDHLLKQLPAVGLVLSITHTHTVKSRSLFVFHALLEGAI